MMERGVANWSVRIARGYYGLLGRIGGLKAFLHALLISGTLLSLSLASNKKIKAQGWKYVALFIRRAQALRYLNKAALGEIVAALERAPRELVSPAGERWKKREELAAKTEQAAATTDAKKNTDVDELAPFRAQVAIQSAPHTSSRSSTNSSRRRLLKATTAAEPAPVEDESKTPAPAAPEKEKVAIATEASATPMVVRKPVNFFLGEIEVACEEKGDFSDFVVVKHAAPFISTLMSKMLALPNVTMFNATCSEVSEADEPRGGNATCAAS
ncbi:unnamed protein product [Tilletia controversa]|nr:unnamed protein product [Tilletia controversa]